MKLSRYFLLPVLFLAACSTPETQVSLTWNKAENLPEAVSNNAVAAATVNGKTFIYSFLGVGSGKNQAAIHKKVYKYDTVEQTWSMLEDAPGISGRLASTAQEVNGKIYIFGGYTVAEDGTEKSTREVYEFDPETETFTEKESMLIPVDDAVSLVYANRYIYLVSGWFDTNNVSNVQVYDTQTDTWSHATPYPGPPVFGHAGGIVGETMVLSDGVRLNVEDGERNFTMSPGSIMGEVNPNKPTEISWRRIAQHPGVARYRMAAIGVESPKKMVVFVGGTSNPYNYDGIGYNGQPSSPVSEVFAYDIEAESWISLGTQPTPTMDHRNIAKVGNRYFIIGGMLASQIVTRVAQYFEINISTKN